MHQTHLRIKFREKPAAVEGEVLRRGGDGERESPIGAPQCHSQDLGLPVLLRFCLPR